jgi:hypothetical protein
MQRIRIEKRKARRQDGQDHGSPIEPRSEAAIERTRYLAEQLAELLAQLDGALDETRKDV